MVRFVKSGKGRVRGCICCDGCGKAITDYKRAHVLWFNEEGGEIDGLLFHVHKGACDRVVADREGRGRHASWVPLSVHLDHLLTNVGLVKSQDRRVAHEAAEFWSREL